jgi:two-component system, OmpR family, copper resistance phosphate regulon response regulator CusR
VSLVAAQMATILCIDDETSALMVRKRVLESAGYQVVSARSGEEGIQLFRSKAFDLVILDYWMPSMNGIATARELRRINPSVPLIILSGLSQLLDESMGVVDRWILKDEGPEYLLSAIKTLLKPTP